MLPLRSNIPLLFDDAADADTIELHDVLQIDAPLDQLAAGPGRDLIDRPRQRRFRLHHDLSPDELETLLAVLGSWFSGRSRPRVKLP